MTDDSDPEDCFKIFGQTISQCQLCEQAMVGTKPTCEECVGKVPIEELEALADDWEEKPERIYFNEQANAAVEQCAQELRETIADYE